jgi:hypothetical protein
VSRRVCALLLAVIGAVGLLATPVGFGEVRAASPDLTVVADARYDVQPDQHRIHVTVDMVVANHLRDTTTKRFYFDRAYLSVLPESSGFKLTSAGAGTPRASISKATPGYALLRIDLGQRLYSGKAATYQLTFDLVDKGGAPNRGIRVGPSLVAFPVWAYATNATPGSTVRVVFPAGYQVQVRSGDIPTPTTASDGVVTLQTTALDKPLAFYAYLVADRAQSETERTMIATIGGTPIELSVRGWADDPAWTERVGGLVARGLPLLSQEIGLGWQRASGLIVHETISRTTGGYAGLFDPSLGQIDVAYDALDYVVLHESAHAWFNGALLTDRWANEAFASYYGAQTAATLKLKGIGDPLTPALQAARIPLNDWGAVGRAGDTTEAYAYAATLTLARAIADRAGAAGLRSVWADAAAKIGAYQPPVHSGGAAGAGAPTPEKVDAAPDWRGLLDLLEADTHVAYDDLWRTWVARTADLPLLDARLDARTRYDAVLAAAGDWQLPRAVRDAMRAWHFDQARTLLTAATTILQQRTAIATAAASSGLAAPATLRTAFESPDGFASATLEATAELEAIHRYATAAGAHVAAPDGLQAVGLWGTNPDSDLARARTLFASGDLAGSAAAADYAAATWITASDVGRGRIVSIGLLVLALVLGLLLLAVARGRRRRSPRRSRAYAGWADPYATLGASPDRAEPVDVGADRARGAEPD